MRREGFKIPPGTRWRLQDPNIFAIVGLGKKAGLRRSFRYPEAFSDDKRIDPEKDPKGRRCGEP